MTDPNLWLAVLVVALFLATLYCALYADSVVMTGTTLPEVILGSNPREAHLSAIATVKAMLQNARQILLLEIGILTGSARESLWGATVLLGFSVGIAFLATGGAARAVGGVANRCAQLLMRCCTSGWSRALPGRLVRTAMLVRGTVALPVVFITLLWDAFAAAALVDRFQNSQLFDQILLELERPLDQLLTRLESPMRASSLVVWGNLLVGLLYFEQLLYAVRILLATFAIFVLGLGLGGVLAATSPTQLLAVLPLPATPDAMSLAAVGAGLMAWGLLLLRSLGFIGRPHLRRSSFMR